MQSLFNTVSPILNALVLGDANSTATLTIAAKENEYFVLHKLWISNDADGSTNWDNLLDKILVGVAFGGVTKWLNFLHPGNGGTGSLEFENGPWPFDFSPGLYTGTKNEAMVVTVATFGTDIGGIVNALYQ